MYFSMKHTHQLLLLSALANTQSAAQDCGNGICDGSEYSPACAIDCGGQEYIGFEPDVNYGAPGIMFRVKALREITITSFDIYAVLNSTSQFQLYTRSGDYVGHEASEDGWTLSYENLSMQQNGRYNLSSVGIIQAGLLIPSGADLSFYLYTPYRLMYGNGTEGMDLYSSNNHLELYQGSGVYGGKFNTTISPRVFRGIIRCVQRILIKLPLY